MFGRRSRRQSLQDWGLDPADREILARSVWAYGRLDSTEQRKLEGWVRVFITERTWEPCGGLELDRSMQITIAGQAGLMVLGWNDFYFDRIPSILVYPDAYIAPKQQRPLGNGFYIEGIRSVRHGESWARGPVILSWKEVELGGKCWNEGGNLVMHEFTHHLDTLDDGNADGAPALPTRELARWRSVFKQASERLELAVEHHHPCVLDPYGLESPSELFAVSVEAFYQHADWLRDEEPQLFNLLKEFFNLDPTRWGIAPDRP